MSRDFQITTAVREAVPVLIGLYGLSGSGKTLSALKLARGLAGADGTIGVVDTENGRAKLYAGREDIGEYLHLSLEAPFQPAVFADAVAALERAGCDVIIVDSISAEWEGPGGVLDQADQEHIRTGKNGLHIWNKPKMAHKMMMQRMVHSSAHLIFTCRGKKEIGEGQDPNGRKTIERGEIVAVQEAAFIHDMTLHMRLNLEGNAPTVTKCLDELRPFIDEAQPISAEIGARIREWQKRGAEYDDEVRRLKAIAFEVAGHGRVAIQQYMRNLNPADNAVLAQWRAELWELAKASDPAPEPERMTQSPNALDHTGASHG